MNGTLLLVHHARSVQSQITPNHTQRITLIVAACYVVVIAILWCVFAARAAWVDFHPDSWANWGLVVTSLWLMLAGAAQQLMPRRA